MQAVLIIAHRDIEQVLSLSEILSTRFEVYVHFDKKMHVSDGIKQKLREKGIKFYQQIDVHWGGWSIGQVAINLMKEALKHPDISYLHLISGQDWPLQPINTIYNYYEENDKAYMKFFDATNIKKSGEPIIWWQKYYYNYDNMNRRTLYGKIYHRVSILVQTILRVNKFKKLGIELTIYSGSNWCDLPRDIAVYTLRYLDEHPNLLQMLKTGCFSDEFWMQTIIGNSNYKGRISTDFHRYILWEKKHNSYPAILDENDYKRICKGNFFWGRKIVKPYSNKLVDKLNKRIGEGQKYDE